MSKNPKDFIENYRSQIVDTVNSVDHSKVEQAISWFTDALDRKKQIFVCGNGGSAATATHFACDMVKAASYEREKRFRLLCLNDSMATVTAYSNDVAYESIFEEQLKNFAEPEDLVMAISGSGNSPNVVRAIEFGNAAQCRTISLTGRDGGKLAKLAQLDIHVTSPHMGRIEDAHMIICHMIIYHFVEQTFAKAPQS